MGVSIAEEHAVLATNIFQDYVVEIFGIRYPIDLIPIVMGDACVIVILDWLSQFGALINHDRKMVTVRNPSTGVLTIYGGGLGLVRPSVMSPRQGSVYKTGV